MGAGGQNKSHGTVERAQRIDSYCRYMPSGLTLSYVSNPYGGERAYFLCPMCGRRARFLYWRFGRYLCRVCGRLNYHSQQQTNDEFRPYYQVEKILREKFGIEDAPAPIALRYYTPPRPRGMHRKKYERLCRAYEKQAARYGTAFVKHACAILGRL